MIDLENIDRYLLDDYIKDAFIGFYQNLFFQNSTEFKYSPDPQVTRLNICDQFSSNDLTPEFKPTIYIRRHPFSFMNTSIDQYAGGNIMTGAKAYSDLIGGLVDIVCLSSVELEAQRLASIVFFTTNAFKDEICRMTGLFKVDAKTLGEAQPLDAKSTIRIVEVPVSVQIMFQSSWISENIKKSNDAILNEIVIARSTDVSGKQLTGKVGEGCSAGITGVYTDKASSSICIPMTEDSPEPIVDSSDDSDNSGVPECARPNSK